MEILHEPDYRFSLVELEVHFIIFSLKKILMQLAFETSVARQAKV